MQVAGQTLTPAARVHEAGLIAYVFLSEGSQRLRVNGAEVCLTCSTRLLLGGTPTVSSKCCGACGVACLQAHTQAVVTQTSYTGNSPAKLLMGRSSTAHLVKNCSCKPPKKTRGVCKRGASGHR